MLKHKEPKLYSWLQDAHEKNQKVIYISLGTECLLDQWAVKVLTKGLNKIMDFENCRIIWHIPNYNKAIKNM